jgi:hypothetical protein
MKVLKCSSVSEASSSSCLELRSTTKQCVSVPCISRALILILIRAGAYLYHRILFIALPSVRSGSTVCILECGLSYTNFSSV